MNTTKFRDAEIGNTYDMTLLVAKIEQRSTKKGDPYVRLGLSDGSTKPTATSLTTTPRNHLQTTVLQWNLR